VHLETPGITPGVASLKGSSDQERSSDENRRSNGKQEGERH
jgi:hypothetical protein